MKARALHEKTGHASYMQIEEDFGEVLEDGILEAYETVVNNCDVCRKGKKTYASVQRGVNVNEFEMNESSTSKGKGKTKDTYLARGQPAPRTTVHTRRRS